MKNYTKLGLFFLAISLFTASCTFEDGDTYRVDDVDAYSEFINVNRSAWNYDDAGPRHYVRYNVPIITENIINSGVVLVYMAELGTTNNRWRLMPRTEVFFDRDNESILYTVEWGFWVEPGIVELEYFRSKDWNIGPDENVDIKIVVIDDLSDYDTSQINFEDYEEIKSRFDIQEVSLPNK